ncbi:MAG: DUF3307 domain-containing protein [Tannerella sp.]|jgi:hypothetical protein|nr:DUF3307 domain-containing protein [Tannerella sp.]
MNNLLLCLFIAHLLADFCFQPQNWCSDKQIKGFRSRLLYIHAGIVFTASWIASLSWSFAPFALVLAMLHLSIDGLKSIAERRFAKNARQAQKYSLWIFSLDQIVHLSVICLVTWIYSNYYSLSDLLINIPCKYLYITAAYIVCLKPSNIIIRYIFDSYALMPKESLPNDELAKAGRLIGNLERLITLTLVLAGEFSAIGFIIAAKAIVRFQAIRKSEYVLIGTLLSFGIAILMGVLITLI